MSNRKKRKRSESPPKSCITVYTDASVCSQSKSGGWACWIKSGPGETHLHSGAFKTLVNSSNEAELRAICNGIVVASKLYALSNYIVVVVTDSQSAIDHLRGVNKRKAPSHIAELISAITAAIPNGCEVRYRKVKAHSSHDGARSYVNNLVDKAARKKMEEKRCSLKGMAA